MQFNFSTEQVVSVNCRCWLTSSIGSLFNPPLDQAYVLVLPDSGATFSTKVLWELLSVKKMRSPKVMTDTHIISRSFSKSRSNFVKMLCEYGPGSEKMNSAEFKSQIRSLPKVCIISVQNGFSLHFNSTSTVALCFNSTPTVAAD